MAKKIYSTPLMEVEQVNLSSCLLDVSPIVPVPPHPGAPQRHRTPVF